MILSKTLSYLLARGIPGVVSLVSIMIYTRMLTPEIYGQYAIIMSLVILTITMCFQWMQFSILRFYPKQDLSEKVLLSNTLYTFLIGAAMVLPIFGIALAFSFDFISLLLVILVLFLTACFAFFELGIQVPVANGEALFYGLLLAGKSILGLLFGVALLFLGLSLMAPIAGLAAAYLIMGVVVAKKYLSGLSMAQVDKELIKNMMSYGIPLSGTFVMNYIMANSDRLMLAWLMGEESAGLYAAGYDLSHFAFIVILMSIHLAVYPMIIKAYEKQQQGQLKFLLESNIISLILLSIVPIIVFSLLVESFSQLVFGREFWQVAADVIPLVALGTLFLGLKAFYFDLAFLLTQKTKRLLWIGLLGAVSNICLNLFLIQQWGIMGAAYATALSYFLVLCLSYWLGRNLVNLPLPLKEMAKVLWVLILCSGILIIIHQVVMPHFILDMVILLGTFSLLMYAFNFLNCQPLVKKILRLGEAD